MMKSSSSLASLLINLDKDFLKDRRDIEVSWSAGDTGDVNLIVGEIVRHLHLIESVGQVQVVGQAEVHLHISLVL